MRGRISLIVGALVIATTGASAAVANGRFTPAPRPPQPGLTVALTAATQVSAASQTARQDPSYWTMERARTAKPMTATKSWGLTADSYGTAALDFTRSRITPQTANKAAPYKAVGKLFFTIPGQGNFQCSASTIANRLIVTAAHCMYGAGVGFYTNWAFIPGYDGSKSTLAAQRPFGTWTWSRGQISQTWINTGGTLPNNGDFGILELADQSFGGAPLPVWKKSGKLTVAIGHLFDTAVTMLGYPCNFDSCNIMQRVDSSDHRPGSSAAGNNAYEYGSDMTGGSSGGPWVENFGTGPAPTGNWATRNAVVAVTSYGYNDPAVLVQGASQFNSEFQTILTASCNARAGNC